MGPGRFLAPVLVAAAGGAAAEPLTLVDPGPGRSFSDQVADRLTLLGDAIDQHLGALTLDALEFRLDGRARRATVRLRGDTRYLSLHVDGDVHFADGAAQIDARVDLAVAGRHLHLQLPELQVVPRSYLGERYVELRVPLLRTRF